MGSSTCGVTTKGAAPPAGADFDWDGKTDAAVFRPSSGAWYVQGQAPVSFGLAGDIPYPPTPADGTSAASPPHS